MDLRNAIEDLLLGASLRQVAATYRESLIESLHCRREEVTRETFSGETTSFMKLVARHLGDRHAGDPRVLHALQDWVMQVDDYEAWDALLAGFQFQGKASLMRRGRVLFPGPLTAHWTDTGRE